MRDPNHWNHRYDTDDLPWDTGYPDTYLVRLVADWPEFSGNVLEIGCGTGTNSIWLARQGFTVTGLDLSSSAITIARKRAREKEVDCRFLVDDFLSCPLADAPFHLVFDRGCFHSTLTVQERQGFARRVASCLRSGGLWFSLMGNSDQDAGGKGPPRLSATEIAAGVESSFEILRLQSCLLESRYQRSPRFWQCLMRLRS
jgi:2-polyprenyl-3-methyl-5-hydroxy-6-metoxy-1,4-benzoquinol methylase